MSTESIILHRVESLIVNNPHVHPRQLSISENAGRLTLAGEVDSFFAKQMAQESLRDVPGIQAIDNQLQVVWR